jgi:hypothetical protein
VEIIPGRLIYGEKEFWMKIKLAPVIAFVFFLLFGLSVHATEIIPATLESMTSVSDAIVVGGVQDQFSYWENGKIFTNVIVEVSQSLKSTPADDNPSYIELKLLGGQVDDIKLEIEHAPAFLTGEKVMLFLKRTNHAYIPYGFYYGVFKVTRDDESQKEVIRGPLFDAQFSTVYDVRTMQKVVNTEQGSARDFNNFVQQINGLVQNGQ